MACIQLNLWSIVAALAVALCGTRSMHAGVEIRSNSDGAIRFLSWDNEGGDMARRNLLRANTTLALEVADGDRWVAAKEKGRLAAKIVDGGFSLTISGGKQRPSSPAKLRLVVPFEPRVSAVTVLPAKIDEADQFHLPALLYAPGFGPMLVSGPKGSNIVTLLEGSRKEKWIDWFVELPPLAAGESLTLHFRPWTLTAPAGVTDEKKWQLARRAWLNVFQVTARWGDPKSPSRAPAGVLGNNVLSDPVSSCLYIYADHAFWTPELAPGISAMSYVGRTLDWWLARRMLPTGEVPGYTTFTDFLDTNPSIVISAWDYAEATGDNRWLQKRIQLLERVADFQASRDIDGDGLVEAVRSGNAGTLTPDQRSCSAYDAVNCGHKDAYSNILTYRAFRCMADMEARLGRTKQQRRYALLADKLKQTFGKVLFDAKAERVVGWISRDGEVHDYFVPSVNGMAIDYGLIDAERGRRTLKRLRDKLTELRFERYDRGLPMSLIPVRRLDYILMDTVGAPKRDDGSDTFGQYLNGGVATSEALRFMTAQYVIGDNEFADSILDRMLALLPKGDFADGGSPISIVNEYPHGGEFVDWKGAPCGYEGLMSHAYHFLDAVCLREPALRAKIRRPMIED